MEIVVYKGIGVFVLFFSLKFTSVVNIVRKRHGDCCFQYCKQAVAFHYSIFAQYISQMCKPKISTTRLTGGLLCGYKPLLPASA